MIKYLVICFDDVNDSYIVDDLNSLISVIYDYELYNGESFGEVSDKFYSIHKVFRITGEVFELN